MGLKDMSCSSQLPQTNLTEPVHNDGTMEQVSFFVNKYFCMRFDKVDVFDT